MLLSKHNLKSLLLTQKAFILKVFCIGLLNCCALNSIAQTKVAFKRFTDISLDGIGINVINNKIFYSVTGDVAADSNKSYNLNVCFNSSFDTLSTNLSYLSNNVSGAGFGLLPFTNTANKLFYWGVGFGYGSSANRLTFVFGNANQANFTLSNHKAYYSKYFHRWNYTTTFLNDSTFISTHWFKWYHPSSLPYGASIWWFNKNMDTIRQNVYFEANGTTDLLPTTVFPLSNKDVLVTGFTDTAYATNYDAFIMRLDSVGNVKYARRIGTSGHENMYLTKIENKYYLTGTTIPDNNNSATSNFFLSEIDIATGDVGKTYKTFHVGTGIVLMHNPSVQNDKIYLPCILGSANAMYLKSCYFVIDTNGVISKQYIHSQASNGYLNSYTMPIVTDSLKNVFGSIISYNSNSDPEYIKLFKLDSNLVGCYPSDTPFSFTTTIANGALHSLPMNIITAKDSIFEVTTPGAIIQGHGFNTMVDECTGYVGIKENVLENSYFKVYPNPSSGIFHYQVLSDDMKGATLEVYDLTGKCIISGALSSNNANGYIDLSNESNGIYFVKVANAQKILFNTKINVVK